MVQKYEKVMSERSQVLYSMMYLQAYFSGQMKLSGNLGLAMQLQNIIKPLQLQSKL